MRRVATGAIGSMTIDRIKAMVTAGESDTLEFKSTTGARPEAAATVCAMLNQRGGHVLFGVTPEGAPVGQQVSERTIEALSAELGRIDPPAFPTVERLPITGDREIVLIDVSPGLAKPYQYRGTAYRRVGNTTVAMPADEYNRVLLERMHSDQRWENQPAAGWSVADLDEAEIRRTVDEAIRRGRLADPGTRDPLNPGGDAPTGPRGTQRLDDRLRAILALLDREGCPLALREIRAGLAEPVDERRLREDLAGLKAKGLIAPTGHGRGARWSRL